MTTKDYKIDLHVHSPASIDYKGGKGQKAFKKLLAAYQEQDVDLLALTDHNTINGYLDYCKFHEESMQLYRLMLGRDESPEVVSQLEDEIQCYSKVTVIPGVEISVYPGIHIILLFDPKIAGEVNTFLRDELKLENAVVTGDPAKVSEFSAVTVLERAQVYFPDSFFCILPHIESAKGAWSVLDGQARADLFKHESVLAVQFLNPDTRKHVQKAMENGVYKRKKPFKFIQASDYHGSPSVTPAQQFSIVNSEAPLDWKRLRDLFRGEAKVTSSCEHVEERLQKYLKGRPQLQINFQNSLTLNEESRSNLMRSLSALLNTPLSTLRINLFNTTETSERGADVIAELIKEQIKNLDSSDPFSFNIHQFHDSENRQRFCIDVPKIERIRLWEDIAWIAGDDGAARPAKGWEIERQVAESFYNRYGKAKQQSLVRSSERLLMIANSFPAFSIASRIDRLLANERFAGFSCTLEPPKSRSRKQESMVESNGFADGDHYVLGDQGVLKGGRLSKQKDYFRFTTPLFRQREEHSDEAIELRGPAVLLTPNGGVTYADELLPLYSSHPVFVVSSEIEDEAKSKDQLLGLTAFLKSTFVLWYSSTIYQTNDIFDVLISGRRMPMSVDSDLLPSLTKYARNIIAAEKRFLSANDRSAKDKEEKKAQAKEVEVHNGSVLDNVRLIDQEVFRFFEFNKKEIEEVFRVLGELDLYDYGIQERFPEFVESLFGNEDQV